MDLVFSNCRLYNGVESYVGEIGVNVNRVYDNLLQDYNFKDRFVTEEESNQMVEQPVPQPQQQPGIVNPIQEANVEATEQTGN